MDFTNQRNIRENIGPKGTFNLILVVIYVHHKPTGRIKYT